jgi:hypothetical protein
VYLARYRLGPLAAIGAGFGTIIRAIGARPGFPVEPLGPRPINHHAEFGAGLLDRITGQGYALAYRKDRPIVITAGDHMTDYGEDIIVPAVAGPRPLDQRRGVERVAGKAVR